MSTLKSGTVHPTDDDLILHYYGELDARAERATAEHLHACDTCSASFATLQRVLAAVEATPVPDVADGFERTVWARLQPELGGTHRKWMPALLLSPGRLAWVAAAMLFIVAAFVAGRLSQRPPVPQAAERATGASALRERVLLSELGGHLDRSQMMLIELVSADTADDLDLAAERIRAERLAADNRLYRQTAVATGNQALAAVLDDLEQVLVDVAASTDALSATELGEVRNRIETKGLLLKVRVLSAQVQQRQRKDIRTRAGQSSS
jgi:hypothetical protein